MVFKYGFIAVHKIELVRQPYCTVAPSYALVAEASVTKRACARDGGIGFLKSFQLLGIMGITG